MANRSASIGLHGFTLIELLVVIAIIALLVGLLTPTLHLAKGLAQTLKCSANLYSLGRATYFYAQDNDNYILRDYYQTCDDPRAFEYTHYLFAAKLLPYTGGPEIPLNRHADDAYMYNVFRDEGVLHCPGFDDDRYVLHYVNNAINLEHYKSMRQYRQGPPVQMDDMAGPPAATLYIGEMNQWNSGLPVDNFGRYDIFSINHMPFNKQGLPNSANSTRLIHADDPRHDGRTAAVFYDGHSEPRELTPGQLPVALFNPLDDG